MEIAIISIMVFIGLSLGVLTYSSIRAIAEIRKLREELLSAMGEETVVDEEEFDQPSINEDFLKKQAEFDERISRLQSEISKSGTDAEILHKDVYNIPHEEVHITQPNPPEEYAK